MFLYPNNIRWNKSTLKLCATLNFSLNLPCLVSNWWSNDGNFKGKLTKVRFPRVILQLIHSNTLQLLRYTLWKWFDLYTWCALENPCKYGCYKKYNNTNNNNNNNNTAVLYKAKMSVSYVSLFTLLIYCHSISERTLNIYNTTHDSKHVENAVFRISSSSI